MYAKSLYAYGALPLSDVHTIAAQFENSDETAFIYWVKYSKEHTDFSVADVFKDLKGMTDADALNGYDAPFPSEQYMAGGCTYIFDAFPNI